MYGGTGLTRNPPVDNVNAKAVPRFRRGDLLGFGRCGRSRGLTLCYPTHARWGVAIIKWAQKRRSTAASIPSHEASNIVGRGCRADVGKTNAEHFAWGRPPYSKRGSAPSVGKSGVNMEQYRGHWVDVGPAWHGIAEPWVGTGAAWRRERQQSGLGS